MCKLRENEIQYLPFIVPHRTARQFEEQLKMTLSSRHCNTVNEIEGLLKRKLSQVARTRDEGRKGRVHGSG